MSGLVVFGVGWCFTWNVGLMGAQCGVVSRGTSLLSIFMAGYDNGWWVGWVVCCGDSFLFGSLFNRWKNPSAPTGRRSERTCYLACLSLLTNTNHV